MNERIDVPAVRFEAGRAYSYGSHSVTIARRTEKTVLFEGGSKAGISIVGGVEIIRANSLRSHEVRADKPAPACRAEP